jgi:hypothetical protein
MTDSQMLAQAGGSESQDSQAILEAYRAEFGVSMVRKQCSSDVFTLGFAFTQP